MTEPHKIASASESNHVIVGRTVQGDGPRETMASSNHTVMQAIPDMTRLRFTLAVGIRVKSATDYTTCYLASMLHLSGSRMLLADLYNNTVQLVDLQTSNIVSQISVPGVPWGICHLPGDRVAVTMLTKGIQFLKTEGQLSLGDRIKVDIDCRGIAFHEDTLIVSFNRKVAVLDMNGHAIKQIERDDNGKELFKWPVYLTMVSEGSTAFIYVSDSGRNTITKLDMNLNILKTFQDPALKGPRSIMSVGNQLLICGYGSSTIMSLPHVHWSDDTTDGEEGGDKKSALCPLLSATEQTSRYGILQQFIKSVHYNRISQPIG